MYHDSWYVVSACSQGDRGYEGPKGNRGPPGAGLRGDKVRWAPGLRW